MSMQLVLKLISIHFQSYLVRLYISWNFNRPSTAVLQTTPDPLNPTQISPRSPSSFNSFAIERKEVLDESLCLFVIMFTSSLITKSSDRITFIVIWTIQRQHGPLLYTDDVLQGHNKAMQMMSTREQIQIRYLSSHDLQQTSRMQYKIFPTASNYKLLKCHHIALYNGYLHFCFACIVMQ